MSDTSQGPGWWQASDGKWYPPELYPKDWPRPNPEAEAARAEPEREPESEPIAEEPEREPEPEPVAEEPELEPEPEPVAEEPEPEPAVADAGGWDAPTEVVSTPDPVTDWGSPGSSPVGEESATEAPPEWGAPPAEPASEPVATSAWDMPPDPAPARAWPEPEMEPAATEGPPESEPEPEIEPGSPSVPLGESSSADGPPPWSPPPATTAPPIDWSVPDPAAGEPTVITDVPPAAGDPTLVQPAVAPMHAAPETPSDWDAGHALVDEATVLTDPGVVEPAEVGAGPDTLSAFIGLVGAALLIIGSFMAWAQAGGTLTGGTVNGLSDSNGWGTLLAGLVVAGCAGLLVAGQRPVWVGAMMSAAALVGLGLAVFSIIDIGDTSDELPATLRDLGVDPDVAEGAVLDLDLGIWIVLVGGAIALLGGIAAVARRR